MKTFKIGDLLRYSPPSSGRGFPGETARQGRYPRVGDVAQLMKKHEIDTGLGYLRFLDPEVGMPIDPERDLWVISLDCFRGLDREADKEEIQRLELSGVFLDGNNPTSFEKWLKEL
jgi:hypothetical protein